MLHSPSSSIQIWVIDDSKADHELMRIAFKKYMDVEQIKSFYSSEEAVQALEQGERPSLVLLDLNMPGLGGMHFLEERKAKNFMAVPVVLLSSSSNPDDINQAYDKGANSYLVKPSSLEDLKKFAEAVFHYWFIFALLPESVS